MPKAPCIGSAMCRAPLWRRPGEQTAFRRGCIAPSPLATVLTSRLAWALSGRSRARGLYGVAACRVQPTWMGPMALALARHIGCVLSPGCEVRPTHRARSQPPEHAEFHLGPCGWQSGGKSGRPRGRKITWVEVAEVRRRGGPELGPAELGVGRTSVAPAHPDAARPRSEVPTGLGQPGSGPSNLAPPPRVVPEGPRFFQTRALRGRFPANVGDPTIGHRAGCKRLVFAGPRSSLARRRAQLTGPTPHHRIALAPRCPLRSTQWVGRVVAGAGALGARGGPSPFGSCPCLEVATQQKDEGARRPRGVDDRTTIP